MAGRDARRMWKVRYVGSGGMIAGFGGEMGDWRLEIGGGVVSGMGMGMGIFVVRRAVLLNCDMGWEKDGV